MAPRRTWTIVLSLGLSCSLVSACGSMKKSEGINPEQRLHVAKAAESSGDVMLARSMYAAAASEALSDKSIQLRAAEGLERTGSPADAMALLEGVLSRSPEDHDVRRTLGSLQIKNGMATEAVRNLSMVLAARPDDDTARINEGVALDTLNRHAEAQQLYRAVLARTPTDPDSANDLAWSLMLSGQTAAAKAVLLPFRGRSDLPERMQTTLRAVEAASPGLPASVAKTSSAPIGPTPLNPKSAKPPKPQEAAAHPAARRVVKPASGGGASSQ
jgi:Flp pilus assembly protein TadD